jgi:hypothetical protein
MRCMLAARQPGTIMTRHHRRMAAALALAACLVLPTAAALAKKKGHSCPGSLQFLLPKLKTQPTDGRYYVLARQSIRRPIAAVIKKMGGEHRTRDMVEHERANAMAKLVNGLNGPERRYYQDVVLRATETLKLMSCRVVHRTT